jgi:hypothetical protein
MRAMTRGDVLPNDNVVAGIESQFPGTKAAGLALCVTARGVKTFYFVKRINGRPERVVIGLYSSPDAKAAVTIEQAVAEAIRNNPGLLAERLGIPVAEAAVITARLRPNPVVSFSSDHLDWLGTGFSDFNGAGPAETALRLDVPFERGRKRQYRLDTAA